MPDATVTREIFGNVNTLSQWLFYALALVATLIFIAGIYRLTSRWKSGKPETIAVSRLHWFKRLVSIFAQTSFRRQRVLANAAHHLLFYGILVLFVGTILIALEHYGAKLFGGGNETPLFHKGVYFACFEVCLEIAGVAVLVGCSIFLFRINRSNSNHQYRVASNLVVGAIVFLALSGFATESLRIIREETPAPAYSFVGFLGATAMQSIGVTTERGDNLHLIVWWIHSIAALVWIAVFPYTRLAHAIAGFLNRLVSTRELGSMKLVSIDEFEKTGVVGIGHVNDLTWIQRMQLDACVSCGRCEDVCPAYASNHQLSPRNVVQGLYQQTLQQSHDSPIKLTNEAVDIWKCTTCQACTDACPLGVEPARMITDMRRFDVAEGKFRGAPAKALQKVERTGNPWGLPAKNRLDWARDLDVPLASDLKQFDVLYWVGCSASYDPNVMNVARSVVQLLQQAQVSFAVLGKEECCTGDSPRRMGDEFLFQELAQRNLETLSKYQFECIVTHCPHCLNSLLRDYEQLGGKYKVHHHTEFLASLIDEGKLQVSKDANEDGSLTYHDPCYLARAHGVDDAPRELIQLSLQSSDKTEFKELDRNRSSTLCCGAGGGRMWFDDPPDQRSSQERAKEIRDSEATSVVVACPFCRTMFRDELSSQERPVSVVDVAELLARSIESPAEEKKET